MFCLLLIFSFFGNNYQNKISLGFDFITGGGGMIFNLNAVQRIIRHCSCPDIKFEMDEPDDIYLGICLHKLKIPVTHSSRMHQVFLTFYFETQKSSKSMEVCF
jgi:phage-related protein